MHSLLVNEKEDAAPLRIIVVAREASSLGEPPPMLVISNRLMVMLCHWPQSFRLCSLYSIKLYLLVSLEGLNR